MKLNKILVLGWSQSGGWLGVRLRRWELSRTWETLKVRRKTNSLASFGWLRNRLGIKAETFWGKGGGKV